MNISEDGIDEVAAEGGFPGVVAVDIASSRTFEKSFGLRHRGYDVPNTIDTQFAIASGSKLLTALAVMSLIEDGHLQLEQPAREVLGADLPLIDDAVTIEHLLGHTSGIGDYIDEDADWDAAVPILSVPVHTLTTAESFLPTLDGYAQKFTPGERFSYCNSGYMVLAIVLERTTKETFHDAVQRLVIDPAGLTDTAYLPMNALPGRAATGYLNETGDETNTLHLPIRGNGDGGAFTTASDLHKLWQAFLGGTIVAKDTVAQMTRPRNDVPDEQMRYGLGVWLHATGSALIIEGYDAGVSFRSTHIPETATTISVLGNSTEGAWPVIGLLAEAIDRD